MGLLLVGLLLAVVVWFVARQPSRSTDVASAALQALLETNALVTAAWQKFEKLINATADPDLTCDRLWNKRRSELPQEIDEHWRYLDDLTERSNRRAEHYEIIARVPAPTPAGRLEADRIMAWIQFRSSVSSAQAPRRGDRQVPADVSMAPSDHSQISGGQVVLDRAKGGVPRWSEDQFGKAQEWLDVAQKLRSEAAS